MARGAEKKLEERIVEGVVVEATRRGAMIGKPPRYCLLVQLPSESVFDAEVMTVHVDRLAFKALKRTTMYSGRVYLGNNGIWHEDPVKAEDSYRS